MDVLSDVLRAVRLTGAIFFDVRATAPWVVETPPADAIAAGVMPEAEHMIMFHAITSGGCWAELIDGSIAPLWLSAGDILVLPMGDAHVFNSEPGMRAPPDTRLYGRPKGRSLPTRVEMGGADGERAQFVCGYLGCDARPFNPLLRALPRILHARHANAAPSMATLIRMAVDETKTRRSGGETVLAKLAELMFLDVVRSYIDALPPDAGGWLAGLRDGQVGGALALMHGRPAHAWTLESLAHEVGLSRSVFADRFADLVQESPMRYLTQWRMQLAKGLLERQGAGVAQVAAEVGYESEAAFNRAFKKCFGVPPGAWRRGRPLPGGNSAHLGPSRTSAE